MSYRTKNLYHSFGSHPGLLSLCSPSDPGTSSTPDRCAGPPPSTSSLAISALEPIHRFLRLSALVSLSLLYLSVFLSGIRAPLPSPPFFQLLRSRVPSTPPVSSSFLLPYSCPFTRRMTYRSFFKRFNLFSGEPLIVTREPDRWNGLRVDLPREGAVRYSGWSLVRRADRD